MDEQYQKDIHIALVGNYDEDIPTTRLYKVLAYRLLSPLFRMFYLSEDDILFHSEISNTGTTCPGEFVDKDRLILGFRSVHRRKPVTRSK